MGGHAESSPGSADASAIAGCTSCCVVLDAVAKARGYPDMLVVDNGPELRGRDLEHWTHDRGVKLFVIDPGKPMQNGSIESCNG